MRRGGSIVLFAVLVVMGLAAGLFVSSGGTSSETARAAAHSTKVTRVTVVATDSKFKLSRRSAPTGTVIFRVTNRGRLFHNFKIAGKQIPLLSPGHSATLRVKFSKKGHYHYRSTVAGQASAGLRGVFSIMAVSAAPPTTTTYPPSGPVGTANTTVTVEMRDENPPGTFSLSQRTMPSGLVTFVITSKCGGGCSFDLEGVKAGAILKSGESETWTVALPAGTYRFHCDVFSFMKGSLTVTA